MARAYTFTYHLFITITFLNSLMTLYLACLVNILIIRKERGRELQRSLIGHINIFNFFKLEYWSKLKYRHNLNVMHIEENICDNIVGTLLHIEEKSKDTYKTRLDLQNKNIKKDLWVTNNENVVDFSQDI